MRCLALVLLLGGACARPSPLAPTPNASWRTTLAASAQTLGGYARNWRFASFFNRVRHQVEEHWYPAVAFHRHDPTGALYGYSNRLTMVRVQLKASGELTDVAVDQSSGLEFLDDEAIQAFRAAQLFPHPPSGLIDPKDGLIHFKMGFLFDLSGLQDAQRVGVGTPGSGGASGAGGAPGVDGGVGGVRDRAS